VFFPDIVPNGVIKEILKYQLTPGRTYVEYDAAVLLGDQERLQSELRDWEYAWFPATGPELDAALERLIGGPVTERIYRIDSSGPLVRFVPVTGIFSKS
jgi:hypothetical protein